MKNYLISAQTAIVGLGLCWLLASCLKAEDTDIQKQAKADNEAIQAYMKAKGEQADAKTLGGYTYYYRVLQANPAGQATQANDIITIYYTVYTLNGVVFDSLMSGTPLKLRLATPTGALSPVGLDAGLTLMRKGEKYRFYLPSNLAFGQYSYSTFLPANSNLIIDAQVVDILPDSQQKQLEEQAIKKYITDNNLQGIDSLGNGLYYQKNLEGQGELPSNGQTVRLKYTGKLLDGTIFDQSGDTPFSFQVGANKVIKGFEMAVAKMKKGEKGKIIIPSHLAYDASLQVVPQRIRPDLVNNKLISSVPPFAVLIFDVEITDK